MGTAHRSVPLCHYIVGCGKVFQCAYKMSASAKGRKKVCRQKFVDRSEFDAHLRAHAGIKEFQCHLCHLSFLRRKHLQEHFKTHKKIVQVCEVEDCQTKLHSTARGTYYRHLRGVHFYDEKQIDIVKKKLNSKKNV
jgi:hypothetical protein